MFVLVALAFAWYPELVDALFAVSFELAESFWLYSDEHVFESGVAVE